MDTSVEDQQENQTIISSNTTTQNHSSTGENKYFPKQVYLIIANEICERFTYYGIHAILVIYLTNAYLMAKSNAVIIYHVFNMVAYLSPIGGAILSDSYIGRYKTILYLSIVYAFGSVILAATSTPQGINIFNLAGPMIGLSLIAIGTGGIKPCVSAFGADQFEPEEEHKIEIYFSIFYFAINLGSLFSMIVTPLLRSDVQCFGDDCYLLAFGVPCLLMILSIVLFLAGSKLYKKALPNNNIISVVFKITLLALKEKLSSPNSQSTNSQHWLDPVKKYYSDHQLIEDVKSLYRVLFLFLPLPIFWALFDQQGSRWTIQAMEMNGYVPYIGVIKPDQIQALNPILVLILIPFFEAAIYPTLKKIGFNMKPLRKMTIGMLLAAVSFLVAGILQLQMEGVSTVATQPASGSANFRVMNLLDSPIYVTSHTKHFPNSIIVYTGEASDFYPINLFLSKALSIFPIKDLHNISSHHVDPTNVISFDPNKFDDLTDNSCYTLTVDSNGTQCSLHVSKDDITGANRFAKVRIFLSNYTHGSDLNQKNLSLQLNNSLQFIKIGHINVTYDPVIYQDKYFKFRPGIEKLEVNGETLGDPPNLSDGGVYTMIISYNQNHTPTEYFLFNDVEPRPINILWQIPQYIIITCGEIMFSITGLDFAYKEAPESMKSCVMAAWLITVSLGNLLVVVLGKIVITDNMAIEFFAFGGLLVLTSFIFAIMAFYYRPYAERLMQSEEQEHFLADESPQSSGTAPSIL